MRIHMCPAIHIVTGEASAPVGSRSRGILTGSHTGGLIGRIPWIDTLHKMHLNCADMSAGFGGADGSDPTYVLLPMVWADNLCCVGHTAADTIEMIQVIENVLNPDWSLEWKPSSKKILANEKNVQVVRLCKAHGFEHEKEGVICLGHYTNRNGSYHASLRKLQSALWSTFWRAPAREQTASEIAAEKPGGALVCHQLPRT
jgi:hypothetical protein